MTTEDEIAEVIVELGDRSYPIVIGHHIIEDAGPRIAKVCGERRLLVVADKALADCGHLAWLEASLASAGHQATTFILPGGEATKSFAPFERLLEDMLAIGIDRQTAVIAFGGGVIGDLAGFAAAILLRGLDLIQIPSTLLSQVDSSVGGKTGINSSSGKNLVGSFHQPKLVLIDTALLNTLPERELKAGYAEVIKYGCIADAAFFEWLEAHGASVISGNATARRYAIQRSCEIKAAVVGDDEFETSGKRALLNFGHTFAHGYEALAGYGGVVLHGEAVSVGMTRAAKLSALCEHAESADGDRLISHLRELGLPVAPPDLRNETFAPAAMMAAMRRDKKAEAGALRFVLWRGVGDAFVEKDVPEETVEELLRVND